MPETSLVEELEDLVFKLHAKKGENWAGLKVTRKRVILVFKLYGSSSSLDVAATGH